MSTTALDQKSSFRRTIEEPEGFRNAADLAKEQGVQIVQRPAWVSMAVEASDRTVTPIQVEVLKKTLCAKFTEEQMLLYLAICARKHVDPFTEAYGFPNSEGGLAFGLRIDGMRSLAMQTGDYVRREVDTLLSEPDKDGKKSLIGARAKVWRRGMEAPIVEEAYMQEYDQGRLGWRQYPETMIRKVAESKALRAAFPDALAGVYEPAEIRPDQE